MKGSSTKNSQLGVDMPIRKVAQLAEALTIALAHLCEVSLPAEAVMAQSLTVQGSNWRHLHRLSKAGKTLMESSLTLRGHCRLSVREALSQTVTMSNLSIGRVAPLNWATLRKSSKETMKKIFLNCRSKLSICSSQASHSRRQRLDARKLRWPSRRKIKRVRTLYWDWKTDLTLTLNNLNKTRASTVTSVDYKSSYARLRRSCSRWIQKAATQTAMLTWHTTIASPTNSSNSTKKAKSDVNYSMSLSESVRKQARQMTRECNQMLSSAHNWTNHSQTSVKWHNPWRLSRIASSCPKPRSTWTRK